MCVILSKVVYGIISKIVYEIISKIIAEIISDGIFSTRFGPHTCCTPSYICWWSFTASIAWYKILGSSITSWDRASSSRWTNWSASVVNTSNWIWSDAKNYRLVSGNNNPGIFFRNSWLCHTLIFPWVWRSHASGFTSSRHILSLGILA